MGVEVEIAGRRFVVATQHVREVAPLSPVTTLPLAPAEVAGLTQVRGHILTVLRPGGAGPLKDAALVIVEAGAHEAALWVDRVWGVDVASTAEPLDVPALFAKISRELA